MSAGWLAPLTGPCELCTGCGAAALSWEAGRTCFWLFTTCGYREGRNSFPLRQKRGAGAGRLPGADPAVTLKAPLRPARGPLPAPRPLGSWGLGKRSLPRSCRNFPHPRPFGGVSRLCGGARRSGGTGPGSAAESWCPAPSRRNPSCHMPTVFQNRARGKLLLPHPEVIWPVANQNIKFNWRIKKKQVDVRGDKCPEQAWARLASWLPTVIPLDKRNTPQKV